MLRLSGMKKYVKTKLIINNFFLDFLYLFVQFLVMICYFRNSVITLKLA
jgi:hypothetical protein